MRWDSFSRNALDVAHSVASTGFTVAKTSTRIGFTIGRGIASFIPGGSLVIGGLHLAERATLAPIFFGEYITSTSLLLAHSSVNVLSIILPGSSEASFSLASIITLVRREWTNPDSAPETQYSVVQVGRALVAWASLQGVTAEWDEGRWFKYLQEIHVKDAPKETDTMRRRRGSRIRVTSDATLPGIGQIIAADIGDAPPRAQSIFLQPTLPSRHSFTSTSKRPSTTMSPQNLKATLRRLSKLVLAGYGGASLLFFGVPLSSTTPEKKGEEDELARAVDASEAVDIAGDDWVDLAGVTDTTPSPSYSWWDVLLGKHDTDIFQSYASASHNSPFDTSTTTKALPKSNVDFKAGVEHLMPRFWILTDHTRKEVVLVLRGTMSLNEVVVDLTCEEAPFDPADSTKSFHEDDMEVPGSFIFPKPPPEPTGKFKVHGGMLKMARAMGGVGCPVQVAVREALLHSINYDLVLCGHSLGAGVAALLGLMWADPTICRTVKESGLPVGRKVSVWCLAPPALTSADLSRLSSSMITSFIYSHDIVSRLSLGAVRDLRNVGMWLCEHERLSSTATASEDKGLFSGWWEAGGREFQGDGYTAVTARAKRWKDGNQTEGDWEWLLSVRKTLEANMQSVTMFPPGRVLWAVRESDLSEKHRNSLNNEEKLRLFDVLNVEKVFGQIVFAKDMLGAHMPHRYDTVLHDLL